MGSWQDFLDPDAPAGRYLPWKEVASSTGLSRTTAWRLQRRDEFPQPYVISPGRVGYLEREVCAWKASRMHRAPSTPEPRPLRAPASLASRIAAPELPATPPLTPKPATRPASARQATPTRRRAGRTDDRQITFDF